MADSSSPTRKYVRLEEMPDEEPHARAPAAPKFLREHTAKDLEREAKANVRRETARDLKMEVPKEVPIDDWEIWLARSGGVWFPAHPVKTSWDFLLMVGICYTCVTVPFRLSMSRPADGGWLVFEAIVSLIFLSDVCFHFNTAFENDSGTHYVIHRPSIAKNYIQGWFLIDLSSSLPLELVELLVDDPDAFFSSGVGPVGLKLLRALRLLRLLRLLKVLKMKRYIQLLEDATQINLQVLALIKLLVGIIYLCHLLGCVWFYLHLSVFQPKHPHIPPDSTDEFIEQYNLEVEQRREEVTTWLTYYDHGSGLYGGVWRQYLYSVYWALMTLTTVGYGDITPTNDLERFYVLFCLLVGAVVFGFLLSTLGDVLSNIDKNESRVEARMNEVKEYLRWHRVPKEHAQAVQKYYEYYYSRKCGLEDDEVLSNLTPSLRREITLHLLEKTVAKVPLFTRHGATNTYVDLPFQLAAHPMLKPILREAKEVIFEKMTMGEDLFFLARGNVIASGDLKLTFFSLNSPGAFFGAHALFDRPSNWACTAQVRCELFCMARADLERLAATLTPAGRDELAENLLEEYFKHSVARNVAMRLFATGICKEMTEQEAGAVRLQRGYFAWRLNKLASGDAGSLEDLMPCIFGLPPKGAKGGDDASESGASFINQPVGTAPAPSEVTYTLADGSGSLDVGKELDTFKKKRSKDMLKRGHSGSNLTSPANSNAQSPALRGSSSSYEDGGSRPAMLEMGPSPTIGGSGSGGGGSSMDVLGMARLEERIAAAVDSAFDKRFGGGGGITPESSLGAGAIDELTSQLGSSLRSEMRSAIAQMESKVDTAVEKLTAALSVQGNGRERTRDRSLDSPRQRVSSMLSFPRSPRRN